MHDNQYPSNEINSRGTTHNTQMRTTQNTQMRTTHNTQKITNFDNILYGFYRNSNPRPSHQVPIALATVMVEYMKAVNLVVTYGH